MIKVYQLGEDGFNYFMSKYKLHFDFAYEMKRLNIHVKNLYTFLPSECLDIYPDTNFKYGVIDENVKIYKREKQIIPQIGNYLQSMHAVFSEFIEMYIEENMDWIIYINEFISKSSTIDKDRAIYEADDEWFDDYIQLDEQVVYYIKGNEVDKNKVFKVITYAHGLWAPYDIGFISDYFPPQKVVDVKDIGKLIKGIKLVFMGAYDGEGIIVGEIKDGDFVNTFKKLDISHSIEEL